MITFPDRIPFVRFELIKMITEEVLQSVSVLGIVPDYRIQEFSVIRVPLFVRLFLKGALRGEAGKIYRLTSLDRDIVEAVTSAAVQDIRFPPLKREELGSLSVYLYLLSLHGDGEEGIYMKYNSYSSLLFPWEMKGGIEENLQSACRKAGIFSDCWKDKSSEIITFKVKELKFTL